ncbi:ethanolaminephosphotransferase 1-like [Corticium candelabrum]|uniref:ethanolaminephosphotransferase 1-like n=1 Tax=Corticium candelabrum TaxID=121492 RepID=UPI002E25E9E8|nr:ethanolaminephosphotransferase 1-like [Corticium candelabrum]
MSLLLDMLPRRYLKEHHLAGFDKYKYNAIDTSPLANYVMHPFWKALVQVYPMWWAPNALTLLGCLFVVFNYCILAYYDFDYHTTCNDLGVVREPIPRWVFLLCGILHFMGHTLDGTDGKQARRTNSSTPLGELFDHGLDTFTVTTIVQCACSIYGTCSPWGASLWLMHIGLITSLFSFYTTHWEKFVTGVMYLPWSYDVSQVAILFAYIACWWSGTEVFHVKVFWDVAPVQIVAFILFGSTAAGIVSSVWNIRNAAKQGSIRISSPSPAGFLVQCIQPFCPLFMAYSLIIVWAVFSPANIMESQTRLFFLMEGLLFSNFCCRLIVSQMSSTPADSWNWLLSPLLVIVPLALQSLANETMMLVLYVAVIAIYHLHYGVSVMRELCDHLNIYCFSIEKPQRDPRKD